MGALFSRSKQSKEKLDEIRNKYGNAIREGNASLIKGANDYIEQVHPNLPPHIKARILEGFNVSNAPILNRIANWFGIEGEIHKRRLRYILQHQEYKNYIKKSPTLAAQKQALDAIPPLALNVIVDHAVNTAVNDPHLHSKYKPNTSFFGSLFNTPVFDPVSRVIDDAIHTNQQQHLSKINRQLQELGESPSTESSAEFRERIEKQKEEERLRRQKEANAIARIYIPKNAPLKQVVQVEQVAQVPKEPGAFNMTRRNARIQKNNAEIYNKMWEEFNIEYNKVGIMQIYVDVLKNNMKALGLYRNTRQEWIERYEKDLQSIKEMIEELQTYEKVNVPTSISNAPLNLKEKYNMKLTEIRDLVKTAGRVLLRIYWDVTGLKKNGKLAEWEKLMKVYGLLQIDIECTILKKGNDCSPNDQRQMYDANRDIIIDIHTGSVINAESVPSSPVPSSPVPVYNPKRYNLPNNAKRVMELATAPAFYPAPPLPNRQSNQRRESLSNFFDPSIVAEMNETLISKPKSRRIERVGEIYNSTYRPPNVTPVVTYHSTNDLPINRTQEHQGFNRAIYTSNFDMQMEEKRAAEKKAAENNAAKKAAANKLAANKAAANKATANKAVANKAAANKAVANKEAANKAAINNVKTKQKQVFTELENRQAAKEQANRIAKEQANMLFNVGDSLRETMALQEQKNKNVTNKSAANKAEANSNKIFKLILIDYPHKFLENAKPITTINIDKDKKLLPQILTHIRENSHKLACLTKTTGTISSPDQYQYNLDTTCSEDLKSWQKSIGMQVQSSFMSGNYVDLSWIKSIEKKSFRLVFYKENRIETDNGEQSTYEKQEKDLTIMDPDKKLIDYIPNLSTMEDKVRLVADISQQGGRRTCSRNRRNRRTRKR